VKSNHYQVLDIGLTEYKDVRSITRPIVSQHEPVVRPISLNSAIVRLSDPIYQRSVGCKPNHLPFARDMLVLNEH